MIPSRPHLPMPGGGARVAPAVIKPAPIVEAPEIPPPQPDDLVGGGDVVPTVDPTAPFVPPPRPRMAARPGIQIAFSSVAVEGMIRSLETALNPKVTFTEDVNAMRVEAHKARAEAVHRVLAALRTPA